MRTDRTALCPDCCIRFSPAEACPRCHGQELLDLASESGQQAARHHILERSARARPLPVWGALTGLKWFRRLVPILGILPTVGILAALVAAGFFVFARVNRWDNVISVLIIGGWFALLHGIFRLWVRLKNYVVDRAKRRLHQRQQELLRLYGPQSGPFTPRIEIFDPVAPADSAGRSTITGRLTALHPLQSPLGAVPCAAYRLVGEGPTGRIDDAAGSAVEVEGHDGERSRVELQVATVEIPVCAWPTAVQPGALLRRFLEERGVLLLDGAVRLAEAVLQDGEEVEVCGESDVVALADGYRETSWRRVFKDRAGAPLIIRRAAGTVHRREEQGGAAATTAIPPPTPKTR